MALRIGNPNAPPPAPPVVEEEEEEVLSAPSMMQGLEAPASAGLVDPVVARYLGPESRCESCVHFMAPGSCEVVSGEIDPAGVCSLHTPDDMGMELETEEAADTLEEMPVAEDVEPIEEEEVM